jgi:hypothetical protein
LARVIARNPELEALPSFSDLAIKSLLYYQEELISLRKQLHEAEYQDYFQGDGASSYFAEDLEWLFDAREDSTGPPEQGIIMEKNPGNSGKVPCVMINLPGSVSNIRTTKMLHFYMLNW